MRGKGKSKAPIETIVLDESEESASEATSAPVKKHKMDRNSNGPEEEAEASTSSGACGGPLPEKERPGFEPKPKGNSASSLASAALVSPGKFFCFFTHLLLCLNYFFLTMILIDALLKVYIPPCCVELYI